MSEFVTNLNKIDKIKPSNALQTLKNENLNFVRKFKSNLTSEEE